MPEEEAAQSDAEIFDEAVAPETESTETAQAEPTEDSEPRDEQGKPEVEAEPAPESEPSAEKPDQAEEPTEEVPEGPDLSGYGSWSYRGPGGERFPVAGTYEDVDGRVLFEPQALRQVEQAFSSFRAFPQYQRQAEDRITHERTGKEAVSAQLSALLERIEVLTKDPEGWSTFLEDAAGKVELWKAQAETVAVQHQATADAEFRKGRELEEADTAMLPEMKDRVRDWLLVGAKQSGWNLEDETTSDYLWDLFDRMTTGTALNGFFPRNDHGQRREDSQRLQDEVAFYLRLRGPVTKSEPTQKAAAKKNLAAKAATPSPSGKHATPPSSPAKPKEYASAAEADDDIWHGDGWKKL